MPSSPLVICEGISFLSASVLKRRTLMKSLYLRPAMISDSERLLNWRNAPTVRQSAFNTAEVLKEEHEMWFQTTLADPDVRIYILESGCIPVGQIRINRVGTVGFIDYSIDESFRGLGYGKKIVSLVVKEIRKDNFVTSLKAEVKPENLPSRKVFEGLGFSKIEKVEYTITIDEMLSKENPKGQHN